MTFTGWFRNRIAFTQHQPARRDVSVVERARQELERPRTEAERRQEEAEYFAFRAGQVSGLFRK
jgi:hypothetical protein